MENDVVALTFVLQQIEAAVLTGFGLIRGDVAQLYTTLLGLSLVLTLVFWMLDGRQFAHVQLVGKFVLFAVIGWILQNFETITYAIFESAIGTGLKAGGAALSPADFQDPGRIAEMGLVAMAPIRRHMHSMLGPVDVFWYIPELAIYGIVLLVVAAGFVILAWQVFFAVLEFLTLSIAAFFLVPFAVLNKTSFLAERAMGYIAATGIKLMVLALILSLVQAALLTIEWSTEPSIREAIGVAALAGAGFVACVWAPRKAMGLINGGPVLDGTAAFLTLWAAARASAGALQGTGRAGAGLWSLARRPFFPANQNRALPPSAGPAQAASARPLPTGPGARFAAGLARHRRASGGPRP